MIAVGGLSCGDCLAFLATQKDDDSEREKVADQWSKIYRPGIQPEDIKCDGCSLNGGRLFNYCMTCEIRKCGLDKHVKNCGYCTDYICEKLNKFISMATEAKANLEEIRKLIKK